MGPRRAAELDLVTTGSDWTVRAELAARRIRETADAAAVSNASMESTRPVRRSEDPCPSATTIATDAPVHGVLDAALGVVVGLEPRS